MAEYIERRMAYSLAKKVCEAVDSNPRVLLPQIILDLIDDVPAADVVPVVRCKDCRHRDPEDHKCDSGEFERQGCLFKVADDYFCAYGER